MKCVNGSVSYPAAAFAGGIAAGTAAVLLSGKTALGIAVRYMPQYQAAVGSIGGTVIRYGGFLTGIRGLMFLVMLGAILSGIYTIVASLFFFMQGIKISAVIMFVTFFKGPVGIGYAVILLVPHCAVYAFCVWAMYELSVKKEMFETHEQIRILFRIAAVYLAGIVFEIFVSPAMLALTLNGITFFA